MSNRLVKNGMGLVRDNDSGLILPEGDVILELTISKSGVQLKAPNVPPNEVCKMLNGIATDVMFSALYNRENPDIVKSGA